LPPAQALELRAWQYLSQGRNVVVLGDLNICPQPLDSACPDAEFYKGGRDRQWLHSMLAQGGGPFVDSFRYMRTDCCCVAVVDLASVHYTAPVVSWSRCS
jgi:exonuclease III